MLKYCCEYTHKDNYFARGKENLLTKIVRLGATRQTDALTTVAVDKEPSQDGDGSCYDMAHNMQQASYGYPPDHVSSIYSLGLAKIMVHNS